MISLKSVRWCLRVFVVIWSAILVEAQDADEFRPGLDIDEAGEKRLEQATTEALKLLSLKPVDFELATARLVAARKEAEALLSKAQVERTQSAFEPDVPSVSPVVLVESVNPEEIRSFWRQQLDLRLRAVYAVLTDGPKSCENWNQVVGVGWRHRSDLTKRALPVTEALREAHKDTLLLQRPQRAIKVRKDELLFEDDLTQARTGWHLYGPAATNYSEGGVRRRNKAVRHSDTMMWTMQEFDGNFLVEFNFLPHNEGTPGALFAICGRPVVEGTDLSLSCGETMDTYNFGVHAYHFSIHRSESGLTNGRKVGSGLKLICSRSPDPAAETGRTYRITIGKWDNVVFFLVDDKLIHNYFDAGTFGPVLDAGSVGMRHWGGLDATYSDVTVHRLVEERRP